MFEEEEKKLLPVIDNPYAQEGPNHLKDIPEEPEGSQCFEHSSSFNSQTLRRYLSIEENKMTSDYTQKSGIGESFSLSNSRKNSNCIKTGQVLKKGLIFYNERILTLTTGPRLTYISHEVEKEIELNQTTSVRQLNTNMFEITNYYPTTKLKFKTVSDNDCEEWVLMLQKAVQAIASD